MQYASYEVQFSNGQTGTDTAVLSDFFALSWIMFFFLGLIWILCCCLFTFCLGLFRYTTAISPGYYLSLTCPHVTMYWCAFFWSRTWSWCCWVVVVVVVVSRLFRAGNCCFLALHLVVKFSFMSFHWCPLRTGSRSRQCWQTYLSGTNCLRIWTPSCFQIAPFSADDNWWRLALLGALGASNQR